MANFENLFEVECLRCESCRREFPHAVFTSDTDMMTADLASLTALTRNEVILGRLTGAEYNLGVAGEPLFLARIARQLGRSDLSTIKVKRRETVTHKPKVAFFGFPMTETIRIYHCPQCVDGEARVFETMRPERFEAKGGVVTVAAVASETKAVGDSSFELLDKGVVDQAMFDAFAEAHSYDAASSMNFLNARLAALLAVLRRGVTLHLYDPRGAVSAASERDYRAWAKRHFPSAVF